jgi:Phytanoyl-CoA dioxygenase (PhyH)
MVNIYLNHRLSDHNRRERIFSGDLLLYSRGAATAALTDYAVGMIRGAFAPYAPEKAQYELSVEEFVRRAGPLKSKFTNDHHTKELIRHLLSEFGCDLNDTYFDVPRLRIVPSHGYLTSGVSYAYKAHRDTWYASPVSQLNWWMPVFDVTGERSMSFYVDYWTKPLTNSSAEFDYGEWCRVGRTLATSQIKTDTRKHPLPQSAPDKASEIRVNGTSGDVILFSSSHLHETVANESEFTRFSIDFRTVALSDLKSGRGGPNIDSRAAGSTLGDFIRASDFVPIAAPEQYLRAVDHV